MVQLGLAAQGISTVGKGEQEPGDSPLIMLVDAGTQTSQAASLIRQHIAQEPRLRVIVCAEQANIETINALIAAGAADVVNYPVTADVLGKKIARLISRLKR